MADHTVPILRVARPTDRLSQIAALYERGLALTRLAEFEDHDGFSGVVLGAPHAPYHLEFTSAPHHKAGRAPTEENLLVFYLPTHADWHDGCQRMEAAGFKRVSAFNPYWERYGRTFEDPDGYRVVLAHRDWTM
ncbi:MAG: VOC family protein [Anaerolineales bacterium]|nr:VOC family protein [Anaerolineales bacterium]MCB9127037.1 VOC family protein [Ardenticatenales bacterium]